VNPLAGSWEIQSYCLGHQAAVTCATFMRDSKGPREVLISGGLDGRVIMWDHKHGDELCRLQLPSPDDSTGSSGTDYRLSSPAAYAQTSYSNADSS
jgi:WD40 repeat protein